MLRRYFLLQMLLGCLLAMKQSDKSTSSANSTANPKVLGNLVSHEIESSKSENKQMIFFVAENGRDTWSGRLATPNLEFNDGPFATWERVQQAIREIRQKFSSLNQPIKVIFAGGTYCLPKPIIFTTEDSGTKSSPVIYEAASQQQVTISGGQFIDGWQEKQLNGLRLWTVDLPENLLGVNFQHLWVNDQRRTRARYPSKGYLQVKSAPQRKGQHWYEGDRSLGYDIADIPPNLPLKGAEAVVMSRWIESRLPITKVDRQSQSIHFAKESVFKIVPYDYFYLENKLEFLDTPGEWYLDSQASRLYYLPLATEDISTAKVVVPVLEALFKFRGKASQNKTISHLKFENLTFAHTDWHLPDGQLMSGFNHNAWGVPGAIVGNAVVNCHWHYCTFKHIGSYAIELLRGCSHNQIVGCSMHDLGAGAIKLGERKTEAPKIPPQEVSHHNIISHNHVYDGGKFFPSAVGIRAAYTHDNLIAHNHVHDLYYTGIAVRGIWGFAATPAYKNTIEHNYVHHIGRLSNGDGPIISDMGGIYNLGNQPGTVMRHNKVHDVDGLRYGGWGIYLDEGSSDLVIEHNLVYQTSHGGFCQHYGRDNIIQHNIFAFGEKAQLHRHKRDLKTAQEEDWISFYFKNNVVYWQLGKFLAGLESSYQEQAVFEDNIYWKIDKPNFLLGGLSWEEWQKSDQGSVVADPLFIAPNQGNFKLQPNSPAVKKITNN